MIPGDWFREVVALWRDALAFDDRHHDPVDEAQAQANARPLTSAIDGISTIDPPSRTLDDSCQTD